MATPSTTMAVPTVERRPRSGGLVIKLCPEKEPMGPAVVNPRSASAPFASPVDVPGDDTGVSPPSLPLDDAVAVSAIAGPVAEIEDAVPSADGVAVPCADGVPVPSADGVAGAQAVCMADAVSPATPGESADGAVVVEAGRVPAEGGGPASVEPSPGEADEVDSDEEYQGTVVEEAERSPINLVFIGHVDAGKSTLCGHLLVMAKVVDDRTIERYQKEAAGAGVGGWYYAWCMDLADSERARGKTEEVGVARFETPSQRFILLDAPGHKTFVGEMIVGAAQADVAILVVSARAKEFEAGFERAGQTTEHILIAKTAGVRYVIVAVNKMDDSTVAFSQARFKQIVQNVSEYMIREVGFKREAFTFLPITALGGGNLQERSPQMPWWTGPTLMEALDSIPPPPRAPGDAFRLPVIDRYTVKQLHVVGKIEKGTIEDGAQVIIMPGGRTGEVSGIFVDEQRIRRGVPGDNLRLMLRGVGERDVAAGNVLCVGSGCHVARKVLAKIRFTPAVQAQALTITTGFKAVCHIHTDVVGVEFAEMYAVVKGGKRGQRVVVAKAQMTVIAILLFEREVCVEPYADFAQLGRFIVRHDLYTIAVGVVDKLAKH